MKFYVKAFYLLLICFCKLYGTSAQVNIKTIASTAVRDARLYNAPSFCSLFESKYIHKGDEVWIIGYRICDNETDSVLYEVVFNGGIHLAKSNDVTPINRNQLYEILPENILEFKDTAHRYLKLKNDYDSLIRLSTLYEALSKAEKSGIGILELKAYDESDYTKGTGLKITVLNPGKKIIKYLNFGFTGFNAVDDKVGNVVNKKGTGPIEPKDYATYKFEYCWFTDIVQYVKLTSLKIDYMDGTSKQVSHPDDNRIPVPEE